MFKDKVVLVTGAVRNTGLAIATAFAEAGATVVLNSRKSDDVKRVAGKLRSECGAKIIEGVADVAEPDQVDRLFEIIASEAGRLDVLVNNAIIQGMGYDLVDTPLDLLEQVFRVNVFGSYICCQGAARMMLKAGKGTIVNIGSNTSLRSIQGRSAYVASKGAVDAMTRAMAVELGPKGIRVNSVVAGYIRSDRWATLEDGVAQRRHANIPLGREATGRDIADAVQFMASDSAKCINGASLVVDGGTNSQLIPMDCDK
jgi:NAD(P)-dependent dehydrogenase (short-subunit alcohol dehydrogenase family)